MVHGIIVLSLIKAIKGLVHPKLKILSLITHLSFQTRKTSVHLWNPN